MFLFCFLGDFFFQFWHLLFHPLNHQILNCVIVQQEGTIILLFTDISKDKDNPPCSIPMAGTGKQQERNGRDAISSSKNAPDFSWGLTEALSSIQAQPRLWHIWVMSFTLGLIDLAPNQLLRHTQPHRQSSHWKICCLFLCIRLTSIVRVEQVAGTSY